MSENKIETGVRVRTAETLGPDLPALFIRKKLLKDREADVEGVVHKPVMGHASGDDPVWYVHHVHHVGEDTYTSTGSAYRASELTCI